MIVNSKKLGHKTDAFELMTEHGVPLDIILTSFKEKGVIVDWGHFIDQALEAKWNPGTLQTKVQTAIGDVYGSDYRDGFMKRFNLYIYHYHINPKSNENL